MANYNTEFCEEITKLTDQERAWLKSVLVDPCDLDDGEYETWIAIFGGEENAPENDGWPGFDYNIQQEPNKSFTLVVESSDDGSVENALLLFDLFLGEFRPTQEYIFSWASTCSRPMIGAFGGGSYVCNARPATRVAAVKAAIEELEDGDLPTTTPHFWDCECQDAYIHPKTVSVCPRCSAEAANQPDSRVNEVMLALLEGRLGEPGLSEDDELGYIVVDSSTPHFCGGYNLICEDPHTFDSVRDAVGYQAGDAIRGQADWDGLDDALHTVRICKVQALPVGQVFGLVQTYIQEVQNEGEE